MHLELYKALRSLRLDSDQATGVVEALEEYLAVKIKEATADLEAQMKGIEARLQSTESGLKAQIKAQTWVIGSVGLLLAVIGLAPAFARLFH
ncbi:MAG: hypothetical protein LBV50_04390 [Novosphingobium sp.]|jgi:seryl-tRNA(Sec) selenium transferase|nr:hypothetical protein [Novosphingobium sp.]